MSCRGKRSGLAAPKVTTLVVDPANPTNTAIVVSPTCEETVIEAVASEEPGELRIKTNNLSIGAVLSVPSVQSLFVKDNAITAFNASTSTLKEIDITNNQLTTLDNIKFPNTLKRIYLDFNPLTKIKSGQLPSSLTELLLRKAMIQDLKSFVFPSKLDKLYLSGNRQLQSLYGLVLPNTLSVLDCSDGVVKDISGVSFPKTLQTFVVTGATVTTFDFRASDLSTLSKMKQLQITTVTGLSCPDTRAKITVFTDSLSGCQYSDLDFADKYPALTVSDSSASSNSGTPTPSLSSDSNTSPSSPSSPSTPSATTATSKGGGGNSSELIIVGVLVLVAVLVGAAIGFVFQRRRKARHSESGETTKATRSKTKTRTASRSDMVVEAPPNSNGFLDNDVRNDVNLIPYRLPQEEITIVNEIAKGGFGIVYRAKLFSQDVVVKQITPNKAESSDTLRRFMDEIRLYSKLDHAKIVRFIGLSWTNLFDLGLVMEYMPNGDLHSLLRVYQKEPRGRQQFAWFTNFSEPRCKALLATDIIEALVYLHSFSAPIIHRDLKAKNVLLTEDYTAKLGDFGISRESAEETMTGGMGTTAWIAPEVLQGERYSEKADIYSFGILMCEMDLCNHPYRSSRTNEDSMSDAKIAYLVSTASLKPTLHDDCPGSIRKLIMECLDFDAAKRPSAVELHYNLRKVREAALEWNFV